MDSTSGPLLADVVGRAIGAMPLLCVGPLLRFG
jgi:hypothetical protein